MPAIEKGHGTTPSERYLAKIGERSFLNLWSYPNLYIDKRSNANGPGKELCDLLVVCGDVVLIFSDKTVAWPTHPDTDIAWCRWYRQAVRKSVDQIRGAERWIRSYPSRIFLDASCQKPFPLPLPSPDRMRVHGIVVALGAGEACRRHFREGIGSLMLHPSIKDDQHTDPRSSEYAPFAIGDVDTAGSFVHVLDDATLDIVMSELDTITEFTNYLEKKATLFRSGQLLSAHGEEDLVAWYLRRMNDQGEHDFVIDHGKQRRRKQIITLDGGHYEALLKNSQYAAKKKADQVSYLWDRLIEQFTTNILRGTTTSPLSKTFVLSDHELGVRYMALEPRYRRRSHGQAILDAAEKCTSTNRFMRAMLPGPRDRARDTGFFILFLGYPDDPLPDGYEGYRNVRAGLLYAYALGLLERRRYLKRIIGIATEPPGRYEGSSEDLIMLEPPPWTPQLAAETKVRCAQLGILRSDTFLERDISIQEFPASSMAGEQTGVAINHKLTRKERRRRSAAARSRARQ